MSKNNNKRSSSTFHPKVLRNIPLSKIVVVLCFSVLFLQLFQVLYFHRDIFLTRYDVSYWKDRVEHSRYILPLSNRGIGDDQFYAYGGYKIFEGEDPTRYVFDKPALGIAIVGLFAYLFNNPSYSGLFFGIGVLFLTYYMVYKITDNKALGLVTITLLLLDPLFVYNISVAALDLPQLFFLLLNIACFVHFQQKRNYFLLFLAGLSLGIFAQIKIPVIYPIVFLLEMVWLVKSFGKKSGLVFLVGTMGAVIIGYLPYALHGYSLIDFVRIQKHVVSFYRDSNLPIHIEAIWQFLFTGIFPGLVDRIPSRIAEWTVIYPIATLITLLYSAYVLFQKQGESTSKFIAVIVLASLLIFTVIPSFPRYVILILPFLYFFTAKVLFMKGVSLWKAVLLGVVYIYSLINIYYYFHPSPASFLSAYYNNFSQQYFQDIYTEQIDTETKASMSRDEFKKIAQTAMFDAKIGSISINEKAYHYTQFSDTISVPVIVTYKTQYLGTFTEDKQITVIQENGKWKIKWKWDYLFNKYKVGDTIKSERVIGTRGKILDTNGTVLVEDASGYLVSINPFMMDAAKEKEMLALLSKLSYVSELDLQNEYLENPPAGKYIPLFTTNSTILPADMDALTSYKGLQVTPYPARLYYALDPLLITNTVYTECCTRIYSSYNYHGDRKRIGTEIVNDAYLSGYDGGELSIFDKKGTQKRVMLQKTEKNGQDVVLEE